MSGHQVHSATVMRRGIQLRVRSGCRASWDDPTKGTCTDVFVLSEDGAMMTQHTTYVRESNKQRTSYKTTWEKR